MCNDYLDKLTDYIALKSYKIYKDDSTRYFSFDNLTNPKIVFAYKVYRNKEGVSYSANIYYWYYLCLTVL